MSLPEAPDETPGPPPRQGIGFTLRWVLSPIAACAAIVGVIVWAYGDYRSRPVDLSVVATEKNPPMRSRNPGRYVRILSLDSDGIRMLPALQCLADLETRTGQPVTELFDIIVGSGSGALIAAALTVPGDNGKPRHSAAAMVEEFPKLWRQIQTVPLLHPLLSLEGRTAPRFLTGERHRVFRDFFGHAQTGEALATVILPAFHLESGQPYFFASDMGKSSAPALGSRSITEVGDVYLADAVAAATCDPSVFAPSRLSTTTGERIGTFTGAYAYASCPALLAVAEALLRHPDRPAAVISMGGGVRERDTAFRPMLSDGPGSRAGLVVAAAAGSASSVCQTATVMQRFGSGPVGGFVRIEPVLPPGLRDPYDASPENIARLREIGSKLVAERAAVLERTAAFLADH